MINPWGGIGSLKRALCLGSIVTDSDGNAVLGAPNQETIMCATRSEITAE